MTSTCDWLIEPKGPDCIVSLTNGFNQRKEMTFSDVNSDHLNRDFKEFWKYQPLMQDQFPYLTPEQREFLISGTTPEEWEILFPPEET
jgi:hypothetical protein